MNRLLRFLFFRVVVRFIVLIVLGLNVRQRQLLPKEGPAIIVANHNSHLDTLVLITLLDPRLLPRIQPVAAMDYFLRNRLLAWFALNIIGILPISRKHKAHEDPLASLHAALEQDKILIFFPEGTRGEPEQMVAFKKGIARLAEAHPQIPVTPIYLHGLGKALPRGEALLVPFFCDVFIGEPLLFSNNRADYMQQLQGNMDALAAQCKGCK